jgi:hypothetical protein
MQRVLGVYAEHYNRDRPHGAWTFDRRIRLPLRKEWLAPGSDGETSWAGSFMSTSAARHDSYQSCGARQGASVDMPEI